MVSAPPEKRLALSLVTLKACKNAFLSQELAACLTGSWISVLMYRRPLMACLKHFFASGSTSQPSSEGSALIPFSRKEAEEVSVLASISPLIVSNVAAPVSDEVLCSDASSKKGASCTSPIDQQTCAALWLGADRKGSYTRLENASGHDCEPSPVQTPQKPLGLDYDFVEVYGGAGDTSRLLQGLGNRTGPIIDLSTSPAFDMRQVRVLDWLIHMALERRLRSVLLGVPCTSFSIAAHPAVRSHKCPLGFCRREAKTFLGNLLAFRGFALLHVCWVLGIPCLLENPRRSKLFWIPFALDFAKRKHAGYTWLASCAYGGIHKKEFAFLFCWLEGCSLHRKCPGLSDQHQHVKLEGSLTKASARYHPEVAAAFSRLFRDAIDSCPLPEAESTPGHESLLVNDVLLSSEWTTVQVWDWKHRSHINVYESESALAAYRHLALKGGDCRAAVITDSSVVLGSHAKGRSSSLRLMPSLRKAAATCVAGGIYAVQVFGPTRLNVSDDPTRGLAPKTPVPMSLQALSGGLPPAAIQSFRGLSRP